MGLELNGLFMSPPLTLLTGRIYQSPMVILVYIMSKRKGQILRVKREQSIKYRTELTLVVTLFCMYMSIHEI